MEFNILRKEYRIKIVLWGERKMEYITIAGPFTTMEDAERVLEELKTELTLDKGFLSISETLYYTS